MINFKPVHIIFVAMIAFTNLTFADDADEKTYFLHEVYKHGAYDKESEAKLCDEKIRENYSWFIGQLNTINDYYLSRSITDIMPIIKENKFKSYTKYLSDCASYFVTLDQRNYFQEAYASLDLLLHIINKTDIDGRYDNNFKKVSDDVLNNIYGILESKRTYGREPDSFYEVEKH